MGNKCEFLNREISKDEIDYFISDKNFTYFEVSAKNGTNIHSSINSYIDSLFQISSIKPQIDYLEDSDSKCNCVIL